MSESHSIAIIQCGHCGLEIIRQLYMQQRQLKELELLWMQRIMIHPILSISCLHPKLEISLETSLPAYIWFLRIIAVTENTSDAEINAPSNTGTILSAPNNAACNTFICMAASNDYVQFALYID